MPGVLPYTYINNDVYVLLGREKHGTDAGKWDHFSGKKERKDKTNRAAAAREMEEEAARLLGKAAAIEKRIFPLNNGDLSYMMKLSSKEVGRCTKKKLKEAQKKFSHKKAFQEKSRIRLVRLADVINSAVNNNGILALSKKKVIVFRDFFTSMIANNKNNFKRLFPGL